METKHKYIWQKKNWPNFNYDKEKLMDLLLEVNHHQGILKGIYSLMNKEYLQEAATDIMSNDAINTSAIEGEILSRDSVRSSIFKKLGVKNRETGKSTPQTDGIVEILFDLSNKYNTPLDKKRLFSWHAALFPTGYSGLQKINVASYRGYEPMRIVSGATGREKIHFEAPPRDVLDKEMDRFLNWLNKKNENYGVVKSAIAHLWFVVIHPFDDGNGRLARAIGDYILSKYEKQKFRLYSLSSQINEDKKSYYEILEKTTKGDLNITLWIKWYLVAIIKAMKNSKQLVDKVLFKTKYWNYFTNTVLNSRQKKVINKILDIGKDNFEGGINTRKYASITKVSKPTAARELIALVQKGYIVQIAGTKGRNISYKLFDNI